MKMTLKEKSLKIYLSFELICNFLSRKDFRKICGQWLGGRDLYHVVTLNPEMVVLASKDEEFSEAVKKADLRVPDGAGLWWAREYLRSNDSVFFSLVKIFGRKLERITGVDSLLDICKICQSTGNSVFLLGGTESENKGAMDFLKSKFLGLKIDGCWDGEVKDMLAAKPAVVFVAYGAPKQSVWIEKNREKLPDVKIAMGVGGALAMLADEKPRSPIWMRRINLEWFWRLMLEPGRFLRIWNAVVVFPYMIWRQKTTSF